MVTKCWPMETRLPCGDQWKAEKLRVFRRWPITRCFIKSDRAGLFIEHSINFRLNGEYWRAVQCQIASLIFRWKVKTDCHSLYSSLVAQKYHLFRVCWAFTASRFCVDHQSPRQIRLAPLSKEIKLLPLNVGSFSFECIIILLIYFTFCRKLFLQGSE